MSRGRHFAAESSDVSQLHAVSQHIVTVAINLQALHRKKLTVAGDRRDVLHVAAHTGDLHRDVEVFAVMWTDRTIQTGERKAWCDHRTDDSGELVLSCDSGPERERLEDVGRILI